MRAKRKGSFLVDVLLGMMILVLAIIPLISSITFAYGALTSSVEKRAKLDEIYSETEQAIADFSMGGPGFLHLFDRPAPTVLTFHGGYIGIPTRIVSARLHHKEEPFGVGWRDRSSVLAVHVVK